MDLGSIASSSSSSSWLLSTLGGGCGGLWSLSLGGSSRFGHLSFFRLLLLHLLDVPVLELLLGGLEGLVSGGGILVPLSLDLVETHTNHGFLDSGRSSGSPLLNVFNLYLVVESSGSLCPSELHWLDSLVIERSRLG